MSHSSKRLAMCLEFHLNQVDKIAISPEWGKVFVKVSIILFSTLLLLPSPTAFSSNGVAMGQCEEELCRNHALGIIIETF